MYLLFRRDSCQGSSKQGLGAGSSRRCVRALISTLLQLLDALGMNLVQISRSSEFHPTSFGESGEEGRKRAAEKVNLLQARLEARKGRDRRGIRWRKMSHHEALIRKAIEIADAAKSKGNHPFGALLANAQGDVLLTAENTVVTGRCPTHHAEMNLVNDAWTKLSEQEIRSSTLYTSCEPCPMCTGAIFWSGIRKVVFSLSAVRLGEIANDGFCGPCTTLFDRATEKTEVVGPILEQEGEAAHIGFWSSH